VFYRGFNNDTADDLEDDPTEDEVLTCGEKIVAFFNAPKVTFMANTVCELYMFATH